MPEIAIRKVFGLTIASSSNKHLKLDAARHAMSGENQRLNEKNLFWGSAGPGLKPGYFRFRLSISPGTFLPANAESHSAHSALA